MKRVTWWPQAFLAIVFNWGVLMASTALTGRITWTGLFLYVAAVLWTFGYDTIYAYQDRSDDEKIGVKSTARLLGEMSKSWLYYIFTMMIVYLSLAGFVANASPVVIPGIVLVWGIVFYQVKRWDPNDRTDCLYRFKFHQLIGGLIGLVFFLGRVMS
jgi:4-hydroxybenzoate polyprenyltransferase